MTKVLFDNDKVPWAREKLSLSFFDAGRTFLIYYCKEFEKIENKKKLKVLDIGCGAGGLTKSLKDRFPKFEYYGCDISKNETRQAKRKPEGIKFLVARAEKLPYKSQAFDIVLMNSVLDHVEDPKLASSEAYRILKKGGFFLSATPLEGDRTTIHGWFRNSKRFRGHRLKHCGHITAFTRKSILNTIKKPGFAIEKVDYDWFYFSQLVDFLYYPFLEILGKDADFTLNSFGKKNKSSLGKFVKYTRLFFTFFENLESLITTKLPLGFFVYVKAVKK